MLVCPQCQFENPDNNKFCQKCGHSLIDKICSSCGARVKVGELQCQSCGAQTGVTWWAIVAPKNSLLDHSSEPEVAASEQEDLSYEELDPAETVVNLSTDLNSETASSNPIPISNPESEIEVSQGIGVPHNTVDNVPELELPPEDAFAATKPADEADAFLPPVDRLDSTQSPLSDGDNPANSDSSENKRSVPSASWVGYLDSEHRYQMLESSPAADETDLSAGESIAAEMQGKVLDCQPLKKSALAILIAHQEKQLGEADEMDADALAAISIPVVVRPYIALQSQLYHMIPAIHDAWERDNATILVLEDRSQFPTLLDRWQEADIPPLQILHWLYEMAELWSALEPWSCCQSLLEIENLRVDEDQALCLQRLYLDPEGASPTFSSLGHSWQSLFQQSQQVLFNSLAQLIQELQKNNIKTIADVQSCIEAIAYDLQANSPPAAMREDNMPPSDTPDNIAKVPAPVPDISPEDRSSMASAVSTSGPATQFQVPSAPVSNDSSEGSDDTPTIVLPMRLVSLEDAGRTDVGRQRSHNEDYFGIETKLSKLESPSGQTVNARGLYILCDGMGGHAGGEVASALAVKTLSQYFREHWQEEFPGEASIREAILLANQAIYDVNQEDARSGIGRMGTTLVMVLVQNTQVAIAHVGDSRLYRLSRKRGLVQVTVDHEVGQREIQRGVEPAIAYGRPDAYQLTQALGPRDEYFVSPDIQFLELNEDTLLLLCSDGMSDNDLLETHWQTNVAPLLSSRTNLDQGVSQLIDLANQHNGHDNITVLAIRAKVRPNMEQY